ncbi:Hippocampus abundant transcript-like protein 1 [Lonchura striata]|uniref:Hippocampus abundant transcript-like protein 1 n=1 Tax=Lonchura striata TaxID=40157 RepID=A0A218UF11_9PASE|nr:Hippocampus abundant transcript-like protein 1 [Lonchura striata domestica]
MPSADDTELCGAVVTPEEWDASRGTWRSSRNGSMRTSQGLTRLSSKKVLRLGWGNPQYQHWLGNEQTKNNPEEQDLGVLVGQMPTLRRAVPSEDSTFPGRSVSADAKDINGDPFGELQFPASQKIAKPADEGSAEEQLDLAQAEGSVEKSYPAVATGHSGEGAAIRESKTEWKSMTKSVRLCKAFFFYPSSLATRYWSAECIPCSGGHIFGILCLGALDNSNVNGKYHSSAVFLVLHETFPHHTFLMNGLIQGVKGFLSFLSAPLIGALSDAWGRKYFLLLTVFFTCVPIPLMRISPWWYFAMIAVSGIFSVTFSVIFAYVADVTQEHERTTAYGLVSATFAASLVISPAIGAYVSANYGDSLVVLVATLVAAVDICFILLAVPESLPEKIRPASWGSSISWAQADPFASLKKVRKDPTVLPICVTVLLSYLPEAGQYSSFFLYLRQIIGFGSASIAAFIAVVGILSIIAQTLFLSILMRSIGNKNTVLLGLGFQIFQLAWYGFGSQSWMMWAAGTVAAMSSITFPAISALVSRNAEADQQGECVVQGIITGVRGLCSGLGPALYGFIFFLFHVELNELLPDNTSEIKINQNPSDKRAIIPGPPFLVGACIVLLAFLVALCIPENNKASSTKKHSNSISSSLSNNLDQSNEEDIEPLLQDSSV